MPTIEEMLNAYIQDHQERNDTINAERLWEIFAAIPEIHPCTSCEALVLKEDLDLLFDGAALCPACSKLATTAMLAVEAITKPERHWL